MSKLVPVSVVPVIVPVEVILLEKAEVALLIISLFPPLCVDPTPNTILLP